MTDCQRSHFTLATDQRAEQLAKTRGVHPGNVLVKRPGVELLAELSRFGLRDQMQRAAVSVPSNIAEGSERSPKEFTRFISIAAGSVAELRTQAYIAGKIGTLNQTQMEEIVSESTQLSKMLHALKKSIQSKEDPPTEN